MAIINQIESIISNDRTIKAENLIKETKILNIVRLAKMLVDLFGQEAPFKKIGKLEGKEIELYLKDLDGYITFILTPDKENFDCYMGRANKPVSTILINVKQDKILDVVSDIIRSKHNIFGLIKLLKYILPGKAKIKGSYVAALKLARCLMIGKHNVYKKSL
ncbi:MAG: hypothetical protein ACFE94_09670 [Candidatus Hodarchaeota archaeon]